MTDDHALRERAYFIWQNAGGSGSPEAHWSQAESEARAVHPVTIQAAKQSVRAPRAKAPAPLVAKPKAAKAVAAKAAKTAVAKTAVDKAVRTKTAPGAALH